MFESGAAEARIPKEAGEQGVDFCDAGLDVFQRLRNFRRKDLSEFGRAGAGVEARRELLQPRAGLGQFAAEPLDVDERRPQIVRGDINDRFELLVLFGERLRQFAQLFLGPFPLGDVLFDGDEVGDSTAAGADRGDGHFLGVQRTVLAAIHHLTVPRPPVLNGFPEFAVQFGRMLPGFQNAGILSHRLIPAVARQLAEGRVDPENLSAGVGDRNSVRGRLQRLGQQLQLLLGLLARGDVASHLRNADDGAVRRPDRGDCHRNIDPFPVLAQADSLIVIDGFSAPDALEDRRFLVGHVRRDENGNGFAHHVVTGVAEQAFRPLVPGGDDTVERLADDGILGGLEDGGVLPEFGGAVRLR